MGLFSFTKNLAEKWQDWTVAVATNPNKDNEEFRINPKGNTDIKVFTQELEKLSDEFIKQYDTDDDSQISYEEFEKFEEEQLKDKFENIDAKTLELAKNQLKETFKKLNVDNENDSKDKLDIREVMNYFHTMDAFNKDRQVDGTISQTEYVLMTKWLGETHTKDGDHSDLLNMFLKGNFEFYKNYKK